MERSEPTASIVACAPDERWSPTTWQPTIRRICTWSVGRRHHLVGTEAASLTLLMRVAGSDDDGCLRRVADEAGGRRRRGPSAPAPRHGHDRLVGGDGRRFQCRVDAAGERLDEHGPLVRDVVADVVQLAVVGDELRRPAAAGGQQKPVWMPASSWPVARWA